MGAYGTCGRPCVSCVFRQPGTVQDRLPHDVRGGDEERKLLIVMEHPEPVSSPLACGWWLPDENARKLSPLELYRIPSKRANIDNRKEALRKGSGESLNRYRTTAVTKRIGGRVRSEQRVWEWSLGPMREDHLGISGRRRLPIG